MTLYYSAEAAGFFDDTIHKDLPGDVVEISEKDRAEALAGQRDGKIIGINSFGKLVAAAPPEALIADQRLRVIRQIKREARRRILAIASVEQQVNDNAAISMLALEIATGGGEIPADTSAPAERRRAINAIRAASNGLEKSIARMSVKALNGLKISSPQHWPS